MSFDMKQVVQMIVTVVLVILGDLGVKLVIPSQSSQPLQTSTMPTNYDMGQDSKIYTITTDFAVMNQKLDDMNSILRELKDHTSHRYSESKKVNRDVYAQVKK
jgi:hypothetical protein